MLYGIYNKLKTRKMKNEIIFGVIAALGGLTLYLLNKEELAMSFVLLVGVVYERFTKEKIKEDFKEAQGQSIKEWRVEKQIKDEKPK